MSTSPHGDLWGFPNNTERKKERDTHRMNCIINGIPKKRGNSCRIPLFEMRCSREILNIIVGNQSWPCGCRIGTSLRHFHDASIFCSPPKPQPTTPIRIKERIQMMSQRRMSLCQMQACPDELLSSVDTSLTVVHSTYVWSTS